MRNVRLPYLAADADSRFRLYIMIMEAVRNSPAFGRPPFKQTFSVFELHCLILTKLIAVTKLIAEEQTHQIASRNQYVNSESFFAIMPVRGDHAGRSSLSETDDEKKCESFFWWCLLPPNVFFYIEVNEITACEKLREFPSQIGIVASLNFPEEKKLCEHLLFNVSEIDCYTNEY